MKFWRALGQYDAETTAYTALAVSGFTSPYTPDFNARLVGLRTIVNRSAATTLCNHVQFKLTCNTFQPNAIEVGAQGSGLQTAPANQPPEIDWAVDQKVQAGVPITIEGRCVTADTPITVSVMLYGLFEM
jgi:hypothetical protein